MGDYKGYAGKKYKGYDASNMDKPYANLRKLMRASGKNKEADEIKNEQLEELEAKKRYQLKENQEDLKGTYDNRYPHNPDYFEKSAKKQEEDAIEIAKRKRKIREE